MAIFNSMFEAPLEKEEQTAFVNSVDGERACLTYAFALVD